MKHSEWPVTVAGEADGAILADFWITYLCGAGGCEQVYYGHSSADNLSALQGPLRGLGLQRVNAGERIMLQTPNDEVAVLLVHQQIRTGWSHTDAEAVRAAVPRPKDPSSDNLDGSWPPLWAGNRQEDSFADLWSTYQFNAQNWVLIHYATSLSPVIRALSTAMRGLGLKRLNMISGGAILHRDQTHLFVTAPQTLHYGWTDPGHPDAVRARVSALATTPG